MKIAPWIAGGMLAIAATAVSAAEPRYEITPVYGYRFGGEVDHIADPQSEVDAVSIRESTDYGLILSYDPTPESSIELLWTRQETDLIAKGPGVIVGAETLFPIRVDYWHVQGLYLFADSKSAVRPFLGFALGATDFSSPSGGSTKFSLAIGAGAKLYFGKRIGIRIDARWVPTVLNADGETFCSNLGRCYVVIEGNHLQQVETNAGLILRF